MAMRKPLSCRSATSSGIENQPGQRSATTIPSAAAASSRAKKPENQPLVIADIAHQISDGELHIVGVMIESNLVAGRQDVLPGVALTYGQSITDGCIDWETTASTLSLLADAVAARRELQPGGFREQSA